MKQNRLSCCRGIAFLGAIAALMTSNWAYGADAGGEKQQELSVSTQLNLVSDYVWRGLSQTWGKPASQITVSAAHECGTYASFFASNVAAQFVPNGSVEIDLEAGYKGKIGSVEASVGGLLAMYPGANFDKASFSPAFESSDPTTVELYIGAAWAGFSARLGYIPTKFYGWNTNNSGVNGVFNSEQPHAGLTGDSRGALNAELAYLHPLNDRFSVQVAIGRQRIPNSTGLSWNYGRLAMSANLNGGWALGLAASATSDPDGFKDYGSLTNNGQRSTPSRAAVVFSISRQL